MASCHRTAAGLPMNLQLRAVRDLGAGPFGGRHGSMASDDGRWDQAALDAARPGTAIHRNRRRGDGYGGAVGLVVGVDDTQGAGQGRLHYQCTGSDQDVIDVSADGQRFLLVKPDRSPQSNPASTGLIVVLNWVEELLSGWRRSSEGVLLSASQACGPSELQIQMGGHPRPFLTSSVMVG